MREHPVKGYEIARRIEILHPIMAAVRNHHERWDGTGYPDRMKGEDIPLAARIVAIADAYDAMATDRPYKAGLPLAECERLLRKNAGTMFDPALIELFIARTTTSGAIYDDVGRVSGRVTSARVSAPRVTLTPGGRLGLVERGQRDRQRLLGAQHGRLVGLDPLVGLQHLLLVGGVLALELVELAACSAMR
jgi:hypothetical protein